uniref:F-box domain-containing protein n=1 Tax=Caenorhabditis japonica TaxID=281687 RepID=A0A8R1ECK0_CAEJA
MAKFELHAKIFKDDEDYFNENELENVFADKTLTDFPSYNLTSGKIIRLSSINGSSLRLRSITLAEIPGQKKMESEEYGPPIRRKNVVRNRENLFEKYAIPELVIELIFSNLRKRDLCAAMQVCKKFYTVGNLSQNWLTTDVAGRPVSEISLSALMSRKIKVLRLSGVKVIKYRKI